MRASVDVGIQAGMAWRDWIMGGAWEGYKGGRKMRRRRGGRTEREVEREEAFSE